MRMYTDTQTLYVLECWKLGTFMVLILDRISEHVAHMKENAIIIVLDLIKRLKQFR